MSMKAKDNEKAFTLQLCKSQALLLVVCAEFVKTFQFTQNTKMKHAY